MSILTFLLIGGLTLKGLFILIESSIDRLSVRYDTKIISLPINVEQEDLNPEKNVKIEIEAGSNSLKPFRKQNYIRTAS